MSKKALVTGAGRGIGRAIALKLIAEGYEVSGCARSKRELEDAREMSAGRLSIAQVDVKDAAALERWVETECGEPGVTPWGLVTAAGVHGDIRPLIESDWQQWKDAIEINLCGTALAAKFFARALVRRGLPGRIALLSGGGATKPIANLTSYCASKSAVVRFGETLACELAAHGITVNSVAPGAVNTALTETIIKAGPGAAGQALYENTKRQLAEGGAPIDKAALLVSYLMSESSGPVTGKLISAIWDPWETLHANAAISGNKDMYTLRRLVPNP